MKFKILAALFPALPLAPIHAENLLWSDNFDAPDFANFDTAETTGRFNGFLVGDLVPRSANQQHSISSGTLNLAGAPLVVGSGRLRFLAAPVGSPARSYDFAAGRAGAHILSGGGVRVEFDVYPTNTTSLNGISISTGFPSSHLVAEPTGSRATNANTDFAIQLGNSGRISIQRNGQLHTAYNNSVGAVVPRRVVVDYSFTSFEDGSPLSVSATVNGVSVVSNRTHTWSNNFGQFLIEIGESFTGTRIDNLKIYDKSPLRIETTLSGDALFKSDIATGTAIGTLGARLGGLPDQASYELVAGEGDADNGKFQITGNSLQAGGYSFIGANSAEGQVFSLRVRATSADGQTTGERVILLKVEKEDDSDGLPDAWEIRHAGNITSLSGNGVADFDGDGLTDLDEYQISLGIADAFFGIKLPDLNSALADTDGDGLNDREELEPGFRLAGNVRPPTNPTIADTDGDGLSDHAESATGVYVSPANTGTDPIYHDTDGDGLSDAFETAHVSEGYNPTRDDSDLDTDGDGLTTAMEISYGTSVLLEDTDGDGLRDDEEIYGSAGLRPPTNPTLADTDGDGLSDLVETNTGTYASASDTGTNPAKNDTDGDFIRDGVEIAAGSDPFSADSRPSVPPGVTMVRITSDASTGMSTEKTYTHLISPGVGATVNGVNFSSFRPTQPPANFSAMAYLPTGQSTDFSTGSNANSWLLTEGGVTGTGIEALLRGYLQSNAGGSAGSRQTYTLTGLTPGSYYDLRIYQRSGNPEFSASGRPVDLTFTNGSEVVTPYQGLGADRPDVMLSGGSVHQAYYLSYRYRAQGTSLTVDAVVPPGSIPGSGGYQLYALTNEVVDMTVLAITGVRKDAEGNVVIDFTGSSSTTYRVTRSPDLATPFGPLALPLTATTNSAGVGQAIVPASEASEDKEFYRIED
ncbi:thrombospondin type 3 repeat-containing protein [Luteolibacter flavescens]|uniref:Thrombospondin type 3 repeat-containing protein n=1 Tax=Luteolibacter flavescens TaxID=1859460 RepID=A0ABT3FUM8_9BACT|nr:thrombospondin type 3 repeat-containing protein [Luteolibacter flavescens]MCW1887298.1 thrombospondin type 3 repeat-containing protein [Luteolibacter flavescens]